MDAPATNVVATLLASRLEGSGEASGAAVIAPSDELSSFARQTPVRPAPFSRLDDAGLDRYFCTVEKKLGRLLSKLRRVKGLSEEEKYLFARSFAATPDERWRLHETFLRSHDLYTRSARRKYGFK